MPKLFIILIMTSSFFTFCIPLKTADISICDTTTVIFHQNSPDSVLKVISLRNYDSLIWVLPNDRQYDSLRLYKRLKPSFINSIETEIAEFDSFAQLSCGAQNHSRGSISYLDSIWALKSRQILYDQGSSIQYFADSCFQFQYDYIIGGFAYKCEH